MLIYVVVPIVDVAVLLRIYLKLKNKMLKQHNFEYHKNIKYMRGFIVFLFFCMLFFAVT